MYDAIVQIATTNKVNITDFFNENNKQYKVLQEIRELIKNNPDIADELANPNIDENYKKLIATAITNSVMLTLGYTPSELQTIYTDEPGKNNEKIQGYYSYENGKIYLNQNNINNPKELITTTGHEIQRAIDAQKGTNIDIANTADYTKYASNFGDFLSKYTGYALGSVDKEYSKSFVNGFDFITYSNYYNKSNSEFLNLNKDLGANRQLAELEIDFLKDKNNIKKFQAFLNNKNFFDEQISFKEAQALLAKGGAALVDESLYNHYIQTLNDNDLFYIEMAKDFIKDNSNKNATVLLNNNKEIQLSILFRPTKEQYKDRYLGLIDYRKNEKFYDKYLYVKTTNDSDIFSTSSNIINGIIKPYEELGKALSKNFSETAKAIGINTLNSIGNFIIHPIDTIDDYVLDNYDVYTKSKIDLLVGDKTAAEEKYGELANELVMVAITATGAGASVKATGSVAKKITGNKLILNDIAKAGKNIIKLRDGTIINLAKPIKDIQIERTNLIKELHKNKQGNLKIGEKTFSVNKEASNGKGVVFNEIISDKEVERLFIELGGGNKMSGNKIKRDTTNVLYTIEIDGGKINLRNFSTSNLPDGTQPWTIEYIPKNNSGQAIELKFPKEEPKKNIFKSFFKNIKNKFNKEQL